MTNQIKKIFRPRLKFLQGTRFISFLFIGVSILIAAGILFATNLYYNIDTGEVVMEEIQRVTSTIRAVGGLIVGGTATQNPSSGYGFEVVGKSKLATTTLIGFLEAVHPSLVPLKIATTTETGAYYIGFKIPTTVTSTKEYILPQHGTNPPSADYVLTWQSGDQLTWKSMAAVGAGDITAVGDVASGAAFTSDGTQGTSLWFYDPQGRGQLTIADLSAARTYTLPDLSGTITLASAGLGTGGVLFADNGLIATSTNLQWDNTNYYLTIGSSGTEGQLRIYSSNAGGYYLGFAATSTMTESTLYYWPANYGTNNYVLTTDGSGQLRWTSVTGVGAVDTYGTPVTEQVAFFYDSNTIMGDSLFTWSTTTDTLTIGGTIVANTFTGPSNATTTIQSASGYGIILDPASGIVALESADYIRTASGYEIGKAGTLILREMVPIMGFDLPIKCNTACTNQFATTTRIIENDPFPSAYNGTTRRYRFVIRYADATTTTQTTWQVATSSDPSYVHQFTVPASESTDIEDGNTYITGNITLPDMSIYDWFLRVQEGQNGGYDLKIYQIFLAAYDEIQ